MGWLLTAVNDLEATFDAHVLSDVLLDNSASPLRQALETTSLGTAPSELCGLDDDFKEVVFVCGLEGSEAEHAPAVEELVLQVLQEVAKTGVPQAKLESVLHQLELAQRDISSGHLPYALQLMLRALTPALHGGDPVAALDIDLVLKRLRQKIRQPDYLQELVQGLLLDNPHRVLLTVSPDANLGQLQVEQEKEALAAIRARLDKNEQQEIVDQAAALKQRQESPDEVDILPCVTLADVPHDLAIPEAQHSNGSLKLDQFGAATNGLVYQQVVVCVPAMAEDLITDLPLFCACLSEVGCGEENYLQTQERQAAGTGGIDAQLSLRNALGAAGGLSLYFTLAGKALSRNLDKLGELLQQTFLSARFDELDRLRELISQLRAEREASVTVRGHGLAMLAASAGFAAAGQLKHRWDGLLATRDLIQLDRQLDDRKHLQALSRRLQKIQQVMVKAPRQFLLIAEQALQPALLEDLQQRWAGTAVDESTGVFNYPQQSMARHQAWITSTQVNFCAKAYNAVAADHADAPALTVLSYFLRNGFLHRCIREQGGAYGGGASYAGDLGVFRFFSYRDPRLLETLDDFDESLTWLQDTEHEDRQLEEAILGTIGDIDRPDTPASKAAATYFATLHGRTAEFRRRFRNGVLQVTLADLKRVAQHYLQAEQGRVAVITDQGSFDQKLGQHPMSFQRFELSR